MTKSDEQKPILLCCAGPDRASVAPVVERAAHLGRAWLVCGVEANTKRLERGIDRYGKTALYVLCRSSHLDAATVGSLQRLLRARGIPMARIMVVDVKAGETSRVEGALEQRMGAGKKPTRLGGAIPPPPKVASKPRAESPSARRSRAPTRKMAPAPAIVSKSSKTDLDLGAAVRSPRPLAKVTLVSSGTKAPPPSEPAFETRQKTDSVPVAPSEPEPQAARSMIAPLPRRQPPRWLLAGAAAAVVIGLGGMGVALVGGEEPGTGADDPVAVSQPVDGAAEEAPVVVAAELAPAPELAAPTVEVAPAVVENAKVPEAPRAAEPQPDAERSDPATDYARELEGLRNRELREVDGILFTAQVLDRDIHFLRAEAYCRNLTQSGISDWRLPTAAELGTIGGVVDLGPQPLWTSTDGDAKAKSMLVYRSRKDEFAVHGRTWIGARALCVRTSSDV